MTPEEQAAADKEAADKAAADEAAKKASEGDSNNNANAFDPSKLSDEDFEKLYDDERLYKSPRFAALREDRKAYKDLKAQQEEAEKKAAEESGKFKELYEAETAKNKEFQEKLKTNAIDSDISSEALKLGAKNPAAVQKLIERKAIEIDDDGNVTGVQEALKALQESDPYLFGKEKQNIGDGGGGSGDDAKTFTVTQIKDAKFYQENEKDIKEAMRAGRIDYNK